MISKLKSILLPFPFLLIFIVFFNACTMLESPVQRSKVSFKLDNKTVAKLREEANLPIDGRSTRSAADSALMIEVSSRGGYEKTTTAQIQEEAEVGFDGIPVGAKIYIEATVYTLENGSRKDLFEGHSRTFTVRDGENQVVFALKRVGRSGGGNGGGEADPDEDEEEVVTNELPVNVIFVADVAAFGDSSNDGLTEDSPLDSIEHAVAKIHELVQDPNNDYNAGEEWGIVLLSDLEGSQYVTADADSDVSKFIIASKDLNDIKTIDGGFTSAPPDDSSGENVGTTLTISSMVPAVLQCIKITGGWAQYGGGVRVFGKGLVIKPGVEIYGNKARYKGAGLFVSRDYYLNDNSEIALTIEGGIIGGTSGKENISTGREDGTNSGRAGGIYLGGYGEGTGSAPAVLTINKGRIKGNKAQLGAGIYVEGQCEVTMNGGSITENSSNDESTGSGAGIYLDTQGNGGFILNRGKITSNTSYSGAGIYASRSSLAIYGGTISGNTASSGEGAGIYFYKWNKSPVFFMKGKPVFGENDDIYMSDATPVPISIKGELTGNAPVASIQLDTYASNTVIIENASDPAMSESAFAAVCAKFRVVPQDNINWFIDNAGKLQTNTIILYVAPGGSGTGVSLGSPLGSIDEAITYLTGLQSSGTNLSEKDIIIKIDGTLTSKQTASGTLNSKSLTIQGANGVNGDSGEPRDLINGGLEASLEGVDITIRCLEFTGCSNGAIIAGSNSNKRTTIILDNHAVIAGNYLSEDYVAPVYIYGGANITMKDGSKIINNYIISNGFGAIDVTSDGVYVSSGASFDMQGGIISNNVYNSGNIIGTPTGTGVCVKTGGSFSMGGSAALYAAGEQYPNNIYLASGTKIRITKNLTATKQCTIWFDDENASLGDYVLEPAAGVNIASACKLFSLSIMHPWFLGLDGRLTDVNPKTYNMYIKKNGAGDGSTASSPLGSLQSAVAAMNDAEADYIVNVIGELTGAQIIQGSVYAKNILINGTDSTAAFTGGDDVDVTLTIDTVSTVSLHAPYVKIKNLKITGAQETGLLVGNKNTTNNSSVELVSGVLITQNGSNLNTADGAGVYVVYNNSFVMNDGCEISNNMTSGNGGGIYCDGQSSPGYVDFYGGLIKDNTAMLGSGIYLYGGNSELTMYGTATVASGNDIYLDSQYSNYGKAVINVAGPLTPQDTYAAEIVVYELGDGSSSVTTTDIKVIDVPYYVDNLTIADVKDKFYIPDDDLNGTPTPCTINDQGIIVYQ